MWYVAGEDIGLQIDFLHEGQFVLPTAATYELRDPSGALLIGGALSLDGALTIPAIHNLLAMGLPFSDRILSWRFTHGGRPMQGRLSYRVHNFVPLSVTPENVRMELGIDHLELPDAHIDLLAAYFQLESTLMAPLAAGGLPALAANQAVVLQAALNLIPSLSLRVGATIRSEDHLFTRSAKLDFERIEASLTARLAKLIATATGAVLDLSAGITIFQITTPADAVTGA